LPVTNKFELLPLASIRIDREVRQRREIDTKGLVDSIAKNGLLQPLVVEQRGGEPWLIAGERRYESCRQLGWDLVPVSWVEDLTPTQREIFELEENIKREDLAWQEIVRGVAKIHGLYLALDPEWTQDETCVATSLTPGTVSLYLSVAPSLDDERVAKSGTVREAYSILQRREQRAAGNALQELLSSEAEPTPIEGFYNEFGVVTEEDWKLLTVGGITTDENGVVLQPSDRGNKPNLDHGFVRIIQPSLPGIPSSPIICGDFTEWARTYTGPKFSLIHCDFPYGVGLFSSNGVRTGAQRSQMGRDEGEAYDDGPEVYESLVNTLCDNWERIASLSCHLMFWHSPKPEIVQWTLARFAERIPTLSFAPFPLIWFKSDNAGIASVPNMWPRHVYEACLFGSRNKRQIIKLVSDTYACPTDKTIHASAKPEAMLRHFMAMVVDEHSLVLDPTCGSGGALRAAEALGAKGVFGLERDPRMAELAQQALANERVKRRAARRAEGP
jgi:ParB-like chromosome segregation protein Spo0J